jgi:nucleotide-binding universal stress UspA family protein
MEKVLWAVDLAAEDLEAQRESLRTYRAVWGGATPVEPVYVAAPDVALSPGLVPEAEPRPFASSFLEATLEKLLSTPETANVGPARILPAEGPLLRDRVATLLRYAAQEHAPLLLLNTHGVGGAARWLLGSFTEELVGQARLPLWVVQPNAPDARVAPSREALFATDFSEDSHAVFRALLPRLAAAKLSVALFHHWLRPLPLVAGRHAVVAVPMSTGANEERRRLEDQGAQWLEEAATAGVGGELVLDSTTGMRPSQAIERAATARQSAFVALAGLSGTWRTFFLGSTTRALLRAAPCPLLVLHSPSAETGKRE